jgi:predicted membrane-bound spermidine synthase
MKELSYRRSLAGIALVALTTLMFELLVNKALAFSTWGGLGYMIIGSAIFGYSIAGVVIAIWKPHEKYPLGALMSYATIAWSLSMVLCYVVMNEVPFGFGKLYSQPLRNLFYFTIWYLALLVPFSLSGFIIASLLTVFKERSNRLYAADLLGAGIGCLVVVPLFPPLGAGGVYMVCALLAAICAVIFSAGLVRWVTVSGALLAALFAVSAPLAESAYAVRSHDIKRERGEQFAAGYIKTSLWSFLSKIEVSIVPNRERSMLWFDGGVMQSNIDRFDGDYEAEKHKKQVTGPNSLVYRIRPRENSLIIAPAGGREVRAALTWGARHVTGVELDPSVVDLVKTNLNEYLGGIYRDPRVTIINDEGRSFVRRSKERYDSIQCISAFSVEAAQSGAVDGMSAYLVTLDGFQDYLDKLTEDGALSFSYTKSLRLFYTAWIALEQRGLDPAPRIVMLRNDSSTLTWNTILVKLKPFTPEELAVIREVSLNRLPINYAPPELMEDVDHVEGLTSQPVTRRLIEEFIATPRERRSDFYATFPYNVKPVTDDKPFFEAWRYLGAVEASVPDRLAEEFADLVSKKEYIPRFPLNQAAQIFILVEAAVLALLFLIFPLWKFKSDGIQTRPQRLSLLYFLSLGLGFIWIEVVFLKSFVLFLGSPVYSIAVVLFAMLIFAGLGSFYSERLRGTLTRKMTGIGGGLVLICLAVAFVYPGIQQMFLGLPLLGRMLVAVVMLAPVGFVMGMPFPTGLQVLAKSSPESIPWAWAMNGYATVVGISSASLITTRTGFKVMIVLSLVVYLLGFLALGSGARAWLAKGARPAIGDRAPGVA